jgi:hypothetical protein
MGHHVQVHRQDLALRNCGGTRPHQPCSLQEAEDFVGEALAITSILRSGSGVGYVTWLYLPLGHVHDGRELPYGESHFRRCEGQPSIQCHSG